MSNFKIIVWSDSDELYRDDSLPFVNACFDGCSTRRRAIISLLKANHSVQILSLKIGGGFSAYVKDLKKIDNFLSSEGSCDVLLMFYPDLPMFHPPSIIKLIFFRWLCKRVVSFSKASGAEFFLDIVDLPIYQSRDLGYRLRLAPWILKYGERSLFNLAHRLIVPAKWFRRILAEEYDVSEAKVRIVFNGVFSQTVNEAWSKLDGPELPKKVSGTVWFFYSGSLDKQYSRAIPQLVDSFIETASSGAAFFLAGEGGEWLLSEKFEHHNVRYLGHLGEIDCLQVALKMDFGLVPYPEGDYFQNCFPSKLGMYKAVSLPVLSTDLYETAGFIRDFHCGEVRSFESYGTIFRDGADLYDKYHNNSCKESICTYSDSSYDWDKMALAGFEILSSP
jgi:hypothetical protein